MPDGRRVRTNFQDKADALRELGDLELEVEHFAYLVPQAIHLNVAQVSVKPCPGQK